MLTANHKISFKTGRRSAKVINNDASVQLLPEGRLPRITKLMALAIRLDHLIKSGQVTDQAELACVGHVSRARVTQIMNLLNLAPDIQELLLDLPASEKETAAIIEAELRPIAATPNWITQRSLLHNLRH